MHKFYGVRTPKLLGAKNVHNVATLDFDREYLRNGSRYRQAKNGVINRDPSHVRPKVW